MKQIIHETLLVELAKQGDRQAYDILVRKHYPRLLFVISELWGDGNEIDDILQDGLTIAYLAMPKLRDNRRFYSWVKQICINRAYSLMRIRSSGSEMYTTANGIPHLQTEEGLIDKTNPENLINCEEAYLELTRAVQKLPRPLLRTYWLRENKHLSYREIAHTMHCPVNTVRSRLHRVRRMMGRVVNTFIND